MLQLWYWHQASPLVYSIFMHDTPQALQEMHPTLHCVIDSASAHAAARHAWYICCYLTQ